MRTTSLEERHDLTALRCPLNSLHIQMVYALAADLPAPIEVTLNTCMNKLGLF
jgi:hypothetical protein